MQQMTHRDHYPISAETYWSELCLNLDYQEQLYMQCLGCESMEVVRNEGSAAAGVERNLRFRKPIDAPAPIRKMFGNAVTMEEFGSFDASSQRFTFRYKPPMLADRFTITGRMRVEPRDGGVEVITDTEYHCDMLGLGGIIERFALSSAKQSTADKARFTRQFIEERGLS